jgi:hypothetical protein
MTDKIFQVVFNGAITDEYDMQTTKARFKKVCKLTTTQLEKLFAGSDAVIRKNVDEDIAIQLAIKIANVGCESYIEQMSEEFASDAAQTLNMLKTFCKRKRVAH